MYAVLNFFSKRLDKVLKPLRLLLVPKKYCEMYSAGPKQTELNNKLKSVI